MRFSDGIKNRFQYYPSLTLSGGEQRACDNLHAFRRNYGLVGKYNGIKSMCYIARPLCVVSHVASPAGGVSRGGAGRGDHIVAHA